MLKKEIIDGYFNYRGQSTFNDIEYNHFNKTFPAIKIEKQKNENKNEIEEELLSSDMIDEDLQYLNFNVSNRKYLPPPFSKTCYLIPKVFSANLSLMKNKLDTSFRALDFGISEMIQFKTKFPQSLNYGVICQECPPYLAPVLVCLLKELDKFVPPLHAMTAGTSLATLESSDSLLNIILKVSLKQSVPRNIGNIFFYNVPIRVLTNTLQILFQRLQYPLFLATTEFCKMVTSNVYNIKLIRFGCSNFNRDNLLIQALGRCLAISSNFQVANLAYFIEACQRWMREEIKCELDKHPLGFSETIYEEAAATLSMIFGKTIIGIPKHYVAHKIMNSSLPVIDDLRRTIFYFLLGIPSFEFWHLWSISTLCFEDSRLKCKCKRGAFMDLDILNINLETLPNL